MADNSSAASQVPPEINTNVPQTARIWNYWLDGKDNFPVDRQVGDQILEAFPAIVENARASRAFLARAVEYLHRCEPEVLDGITVLLQLPAGEENGAMGVYGSRLLNRLGYFGRLNLYDEPRVTLLGTIDVVFCRNVIIYFDDASKRTVINSFFNRIVDSGYLLLGHSESLISLSTQFKLRHLKNDMVYQK